MLCRRWLKVTSLSKTPTHLLTLLSVLWGSLDQRPHVLPSPFEDHEYGRSGVGWDNDWWPFQSTWTGPSIVCPLVSLEPLRPSTLVLCPYSGMTPLGVTGRTNPLGERYPVCLCLCPGRESLISGLPFYLQKTERFRWHGTSFVAPNQSTVLRVRVSESFRQQLLSSRSVFLRTLLKCDL